MTPLNYVPAFDDSVVQYHTGNPNDSRPINQDYCLMPSSAQVLASFWNPPPKILTEPPIPQAPGSPFAFNHGVPWFLFSNGAHKNAGQLAIYWRWFQPAFAWDFAKDEINTSGVPTTT